MALVAAIMDHVVARIDGNVGSGALGAVMAAGAVVSHGDPGEVAHLDMGAEICKMAISTIDRCLDAGGAVSENTCKRGMKRPLRQH